MWCVEQLHVCCSAEMTGTDGSWIPAAVKLMPYSKPHHITAVATELAALKATQGCHHVISYLAHAEMLLNGKPHVCIATRYAFCSETAYVTAAM